MVRITIWTHLHFLAASAYILATAMVCAEAGASEKLIPKADAFGDPLPRGAVARIGTTRLRHGEPIHSLVLSKDGAVLATGGQDRYTSARVWEAKTGKLLLAVDDQGDSVALSPDGQTLIVSGNRDRVLRIWEVKSGKETRQIKVQGTAERPAHGTSHVVISPSGDVLAVATWTQLDGDGESRILTTRLVKIATGVTLAHLATPNDLGAGSISYAFSPDGRMLAAISGKESRVQLWETASGKLRATLSNINCLACTFAPDGKTLAVGDSESIRLIDVQTLKETRSLTGFATKDFAGNKVYSGPGPLAFSHDGKHLAAGGTTYDDLIRVWDTGNGEVVQKIQRGPAFVVPLAFTPDGKTLIAANGPMIRQWDVATGKESLLAKTPRLKLYCAVFSPDGKTLAAGGDAGVRLYETATYKEFQHLDEKWVHALAFVPDRKHLVAAGAKLSLFGIESGKKVRTFDGHTSGVPAVVVTIDGKTLVSGSYDGTLRLWDVDSGKETSRFDGSFGGGRSVAIHAVALIPNSKNIAMQRGGEAALWNLETKQVGAKFAGYQWDGPSGPMAVSPDGRLLACEGQANSWDTVVLHEVEGAKPARRLGRREDSGEPHWGLSFAFSPDGKLLATGSADRSVRLWDVANGKEMCRFDGHVDRVAHVAFAPDGKTLASASWDGTVVIWDTRILKTEVP